MNVKKISTEDFAHILEAGPRPKCYYEEYAVIKNMNSGECICFNYDSEKEHSNARLRIAMYKKNHKNIEYASRKKELAVYVKKL